jgi:hypothetical protein
MVDEADKAPREVVCILKGHTLPKRVLYIDHLLVRIHLIIEMVQWTGLAPWGVETLPEFVSILKGHTLPRIVCILKGHVFPEVVCILKGNIFPEVYWILKGINLPKIVCILKVNILLIFPG